MTDLEAPMEAGWAEFRQALAALPPARFDDVTGAGWSVKEMVAHVAFWEETVWPFVEGMLRGRDWPATEAWYGGGSIDTAAGWPPADVHNAREAAWARDRSVEEVLGRLDRAHARALETVAGLTDEERADPRFVDEVRSETYGHYPEHLAELLELEASE